MLRDFLVSPPSSPFLPFLPLSLTSFPLSRALAITLDPVITPPPVPCLPKTGPGSAPSNPPGPAAAGNPLSRAPPPQPPMGCARAKGALRPDSPLAFIPLSGLWDPRVPSHSPSRGLFTHLPLLRTTRKQPLHQNFRVFFTHLKKKRPSPQILFFVPAKHITFRWVFRPLEIIGGALRSTAHPLIFRAPAPAPDPPSTASDSNRPPALARPSATTSVTRHNNKYTPHW